MSTLTVTNTFTDGQTGTLGTKIQQNFTDIAAVLNGNIEDTNIIDTAQLSINSLTANVITTSNWQDQTAQHNVTVEVLNTKIFKIENSSHTSLFEVNQTGVITVPIGKTSLYPIGVIIFFSGSWTDNSTIPGWFKCDGTNGTPNLTNLFVRGSSSPGTTGGTADLTMGTHSHTPTVGNNSTTHTHTFSGTTDSEPLVHHHAIPYHYPQGTDASGYVLNDVSSGQTSGRNTYQQSDEMWSAGGNQAPHTHTFSGTSSVNTSSHNHTVTIDNAGAGQTGVGQNIPAYYTLIPCMRVS